MPSPTVAAYLARLPQGIHSYPHVVVKASVIHSSLDRLPGGGPLPKTGVTAFDFAIANPPNLNEWVPQAHHCVLLATIYDTWFANAGGVPAFNDWIYARQRQLFAGPLYRILFTVANPNRIVVGFANRWRAFRRGVDVKVVKNEPGDIAMKAFYPPNLIEPLTLEGLCVALRAAIDATGGRVTRVAWRESAPGEALYEATFRRRSEVDDDK